MSTRKSALDKDAIGNTLFQEICDTKTNPDDPTQTLKTVGQNVESNEVNDIDSFFEAAKSKSSISNCSLSVPNHKLFRTIR